jgi:transcriptional regulator with XRE-family HTH domain
MSVVSRGRRQKSWQIADELASLLGTMSEELGERLRRAARAQGITSDEEAARLVGVSYRQYQRWLSGESDPRGSNLKLISEKLGVPIAELVGAPDPSQLDRIEDMLQVLVGRSSPEDGGVVADAVDPLLEGVDPPKPPGHGRPGRKPGAPRRSAS